MSFSDPRLVDLYDLDNPDGPDHDFYRALADALDARRVLDLGCGTGLLTVTFARSGREVVGVDPSAAMIEHARRRPGGDDVRWVLGDSSAIPAASDGAGVDLAVLTGNVAQHIPDPAWQQTLADVRRALRPGGVLAFETRNPSDRAWLGWASGRSERATVHGVLREWDEVEELAPGRVLLRSHNEFRDGERVTEESELAFRDEATLRRQLAEAGFAVDRVVGDWEGGPVKATSRLLIITARAV
ncbi:class I SAM-dependent methyltransferase [Serinibacter arcticus]|uniref:Class I SAM-dependent methyltransferase n=1 Tax=Serinibacter arcticus TaxID=1655435 RepID=A0A2U1ZVU5_9MICO|nr:class I SAM-dependent methyltransferase [Serinibacter arcticus]PWD51060.1 class I SAM-dependent methyltransferase [Serinibacter arcticus]